MLGSTLRILEQDGTCARSQRTRAGIFLDKDTGQSVLESFGIGEGYLDHVTQRQDGAGGGGGGGDLRHVSRERRHWNLAVDKAYEGDSHALSRGVRSMGDARGDQESWWGWGGGRSGMERERGVADRVYFQLWSKCGYGALSGHMCHQTMCPLLRA